MVPAGGRTAPGWRMRTVLLLAGLAAVPAAAAAQPAPPAPAMAPGDAAALAAVGWFGRGTRPAAGQGNCTLTLVAPDLILTAGHCVPGGPDAAREIGAFTFLAGWAGGRAAAGARAAEIIRAAPDPARGAPLAGDIALVRLNRRIAAAEVAPLPLADGSMEPGAPVMTIGHPIAAPDVAERQEDCRVLQVEAAVAALDCPAAGGYSGGPVLSMEWDGWHVAGVVVARGRGGEAAGSYAVTVPGDLRARIAGR